LTEMRDDILATDFLGLSWGFAYASGDDQRAGTVATQQLKRQQEAKKQAKSATPDKYTTPRTSNLSDGRKTHERT
jgi:hypothetical protein